MADGADEIARLKANDPELKMVRWDAANFNKCKQMEQRPIVWMTGMRVACCSVLGSSGVSPALLGSCEAML